MPTDRRPAWLLEVVRADTRRGEYLAGHGLRRDRWDAGRVLLGARCPTCGHPLVVVVADDWAAYDVWTALVNAGGCLHRPA